MLIIVHLNLWLSCYLKAAINLLCGNVVTDFKQTLKFLVITYCVANRTDSFKNVVLPGNAVYNVGVKDGGLHFDSDTIVKQISKLQFSDKSVTSEGLQLRPDGSSFEVGVLVFSRSRKLHFENDCYRYD